MAKRKFQEGQFVELKKPKLFWWRTKDGGHRHGYLQTGRVIRVERMGPRLLYQVHMADEEMNLLFDGRFKVYGCFYSYELNAKNVEIKLEDLI